MILILGFMLLFFVVAIVLVVGSFFMVLVLWGGGGWVGFLGKCWILAHTQIKAYTWLCIQGSPPGELREQYKMPRIKGTALHRQVLSTGPAISLAQGVVFVLGQ